MKIKQLLIRVRELYSKPLDDFYFGIVKSDDKVNRFNDLINSKTFKSIMKLQWVLLVFFLIVTVPLQIWHIMNLQTCNQYFDFVGYNPYVILPDEDGNIMVFSIQKEMNVTVNQAKEMMNNDNDTRYLCRWNTNKTT